MSTPSGPYQGPPSDGEYSQGGQYPQDPYGRNPQGGQYPQDPYGQYPQGQYPQGGQYPYGQYGQGNYGDQYGQPGYPGQQYQPGGYPPGQGYGGPGGYQPPPQQSLFRRGVFWVSLAAVIVIAAGVVVGLVLTSGGDNNNNQAGGSGNTSQSQSATPSDSSSDPTGFGTSADSSSVPSASPSETGSAQTTSTAGAGRAALGSPIDMKGIEDGERLAVAATAVDQKAQPTDTYDAAPAGMHYVAVQFLLHNTGTVNYEDAVNNCVDVADTAGSSYKIAYVSGISSGKTFDSVTVAPGKSLAGWSVFAVPDGKTIASVSYKMDSGIAGGGSWNV